MSDSFSIISLGFQLGNCASTATANLLLSLLIVYRKELRREKELILLAYYCFTDALYAYGAFYLALRRFQSTLWPYAFPDVSPNNCIFHPLHLLIVFSYPAVPLAELALTIDRGYAIFRPAKYFRMDHRASIRMVIGITIIAFSFVGYCIYDSLTRSDPPLSVRYGCYPEVYSTIFNSIMFGGKAVLYAICCIVYLPIICRLLHLHGTHKKCKCQQCQMKRSCANIGVLIVGLLVLIIVPTPCLLFFPDSKVVELLFYNLALSKPWLNVIFALVSFSQIRRLVFPVLKKRFAALRNSRGSRISSAGGREKEFEMPTTRSN
ncbi:unnamed protein product, partial [Mesorhabditis belari]|uniref:G-protein coupled receptors family 1 profile domain-containing protein n=1 Tax=Mesorhabditis belari TaxID=2138241 RepID=A0AAF3EY22_9BILA